MPVFKWGGFALIICCGIFAGRSIVLFERRKYMQIEGFVALLQYVRLQIECFSLPVPKILAQCDEKILTACGVEGTPHDFEALLSKTTLYLSEEYCRLLYEFATRLGSGYREEQLRCCEYYLTRLQTYLDSTRTELVKRERMAYFLPPALALALGLLLL